jgi:cytochrome c5
MTLGGTLQRYLMSLGIGGRRTVLALGTLVWAVALTTSEPVLGQAPTKTVWDGVFTGTQAERGRVAYQQHCAECHGASLGGGEAVPLTGDRFGLSWRESTVDRLNTQISKSMPASEDGSLAGSLSPGVYIDIVSHILNSNGFPTGAVELTPENAAGVAIIAKSGPGELPASASAQVVGCLTRVAARTWKVTSASRPVRSGPLYSALPGTTPLGDREFPLLFVLTSLDKLENNRVLVTGRLEGDAGVKGINVSTVSSVGPSCP